MGGAKSISIGGADASFPKERSLKLEVANQASALSLLKVCITFQPNYRRHPRRLDEKSNFCPEQCRTPTAVGSRRIRSPCRAQPGGLGAFLDLTPSASRFVGELRSQRVIEARVLRDSNEPRA